MIQLTKDLLLANSNLTTTHKEAKKNDSNSSGKDFASILEMEDGGGAKPELAEVVCAEGGTVPAESAENGKKVLNMGDEFLSVNINLQLLINDPGNQSIDAGEAEEDESGEIIISDEGEDESGKTEPVNVDIYTLNVSVENVNLQNINLENVILENIGIENVSGVNSENVSLINTTLENVSSENVNNAVNSENVNAENTLLENVNVENVSLKNIISENVGLENINDSSISVSDVNVHGAGDIETPPEKSAEFNTETPVPQINQEYQTLRPENESGVDLLPIDETAGQDISKPEMTDIKVNIGITHEANLIKPEIIETPVNNNEVPGVVEPVTENVDFASKMAETGEVLVNQNIKTASKTEAKPNKKLEAVNKTDSDTVIPEEKVSVLTAGEDVDNARTKTAAQTGGSEESAGVNTDSDAEKNNVVINKTRTEDKVPEVGAEKPEWGNKRPLTKEAGTAAHELDIEKDITAPRPEFQDFMDKITENRSAPQNGAAKAQPQPQQMNLVNRGPAAFSESVAHVVRFTTGSGGLTKATLIVDPPALGRVNIEITSADNGIETVLKVSNEQVKILVQDQIIQLKQNLAQIGVNLAEFSVDVQQDDERQRGQSFNNKKRTRYGAAEEDESEAEKIETFRVDLRKGLLHWIA